MEEGEGRGAGNGIPQYRHDHVAAAVVTTVLSRRASGWAGRQEQNVRGMGEDEPPEEPLAEKNNKLNWKHMCV
jgi:hypothetical protein